jgi:hypothetical protein
MMRKDVSEGQRAKLKKSEKMMRKTFHEVKGQSSKNPFLVECFEK